MKLTLMGEFPQAALNAMYECVAQYPGLFEVDVVDTLEKQKNMHDAECVIMRILKMPREVIEQNPNLKFIQKWGAGFDTVDIEAAAEPAGCQRQLHRLRFPADQHLGRRHHV